MREHKTLGRMPRAPRAERASEKASVFFNLNSHFAHGTHEHAPVFDRFVVTSTLSFFCATVSAIPMRFCAPVDPAPRLAVLGVLTTDGHRDYREAIRSSWMRKSTLADITTRFVMRGLGSAAEDEARRHGDIVFVEALASANRKIGPLQSLVMWWQCAVETWPQASLIGKADDDIWVNPKPISLPLPLPDIPLFAYPYTPTPILTPIPPPLSLPLYPYPYPYIPIYPYPHPYPYTLTLYNPNPNPPYIGPDDRHCGAFTRLAGRLSGPAQLCSGPEAAGDVLGENGDIPLELREGPTHRFCPKVRRCQSEDKVLQASPVRQRQSCTARSPHRGLWRCVAQREWPRASHRAVQLCKR
jgi:hypothetical protein